MAAGLLRCDPGHHLCAMDGMTIWHKSSDLETTAFAEAISHARQWTSLWAYEPVVPLVEEVAYIDPADAFAVFAGDAHAVLLDSAIQEGELGRYSTIAPEPFAALSSKNGWINCDGQQSRGSPFAALRAQLARFSLEPVPGLPPFQGGAVGTFGYELAQHLERLPLAPQDDMGFPDLLLGFHDVVIAFDHAERRAWICSSGFPEQAAPARRARAAARLRHIAGRLKAARPLGAPPAPHGRVEIASNFTRAGYEAAVQRVIDYIFAGDIFQANLSQRFSATLPADLEPYDLYRRLRARNPASFAAFLKLDDVTIASASPERFLRLENGQVETRPIKGTRPRGRTPAEDEALAAALTASEKDRAENVMIVDLLRNDLSRVCRDGSVDVPALCALQALPTVFHLVSTVTAELRPGLGAVDLLAACFPGGSITGAPKIRAMEIIAALEPTRRGPYCGSIGYIGFDGSVDTSITIRTYAMRGRRVTFQAGGGIVADSKPTEEYDETLAKARALVAALGGELA
jgi:para-aminobenzoate synthetase component I